MKKKILIAGGTGFIGHHLYLKCIKKNYDVTILSQKKINKKINKKIKLICCDIANRKKLFVVLENKKFDYVVNLAGHINHKNKIKTLKSHFQGCKNLADYFKNQKIKKFIQAGSSVEYGKISAPQTENKGIKDKKFLRSYYGIAKFKATNYLLNLHKKYFLPCTILRFFLVYGPMQTENRIIPFVIKNCINGKFFKVSSGNQERDFLFIDDAVDAILKTLNNTKSNGKIINICSGKPIKISQIILLIVKILKNGRPIFGKIKLRPDEPVKLYSNYAKARKILKWKPKITLLKGLSKTIKNYANRY